MISRRRFVQSAGVAIGASGLARAPSMAWATGTSSANLAADLAKIERESGGRLGVAVLDTLTGARVAHRGDERFPICSTFKLLAAAAILARVDAGKERLDRRIRFEAREVVVNSAITKDRVGGAGMSLEELCRAAMIVSDNTAGNLLLAALGGPAELTSYARSLGDTVTRLDRTEPDLNAAVPDDPRDTTSPAAMLSNLQTLALGNVLSRESRKRLTDWLLENKTSDTRLRAGLPSGWRVGDKTGTGERGTTNDVGLIWPPERAPVLVSIYLTGAPRTNEQRNATIAAVGRAVASRIGAMH
jgi:beta-lactamase class A